MSNFNVIEDFVDNASYNKKFYYCSLGMVLENKPSIICTKRTHCIDCKQIREYEKVKCYE